MTEQRMNWKTIDTAPDDGVKILVGFQGQFDWMSYVAPAFGVRTGAGMPFARPTHWTPMGTCDCCNAPDVEVSRAFVTGIETFACDKCRGVEEEQSDPGALWITREKDGRVTVKVRTPDDVSISAVSIPAETWAELIAPHIPRGKPGLIFECPDCGKDIADCTEPHDGACLSTVNPSAKGELNVET